MPKRRHTHKKGALFGRALLPPEKFHTSKHGKRGYNRMLIRHEEREARREVSGEGWSPPAQGA